MDDWWYPYVGNHHMGLKIGGSSWQNFQQLMALSHLIQPKHVLLK